MLVLNSITINFDKFLEPKQNGEDSIFMMNENIKINNAFRDVQPDLHRTAAQSLRLYVSTREASIRAFIIFSVSHHASNAAAASKYL